MEFNNGVSNNSSNLVGLDISLQQQRVPPNHHLMSAYAAVRSKNGGGGGSDEDGMTPETSAEDGNRKTTPSASPWQRMKWTDNMVRLLIMVVFYTGDDADPAPAKKKSAGAGAGALQKKGKWKSVSQAMVERGFSVSPQQCEDKFNDLNKRYKRVNEILGRGTACKVVENQALLDAMDHLSPKAKDEVRKLLNSKHLFFREMCAYHNSCGHVCETVPNLSRDDSEGLKLGKNFNVDDGEDEDDEEEDEEDGEDAGSARKKARMELAVVSPWIQQIGTELMAVLQDRSKGGQEKVRWMKTKIVQLEEQRIRLKSQALELELQKMKWMKFSSKKEREMERERLGNERLTVENERMVLLIKHKEMDLFDHQSSHL